MNCLEENEDDHSNILQSICYNNLAEIYIDFPNFKQYDNNVLITDHIIRILNNALTFQNTFIIHFNVKSMSIADVEKYYSFIKYFSLIMQVTFPNKLQKCYMYNTPVIFKQIFAAFSVFIDKQSLKKFHIVV